jgi:hypothetical protein
MRIMVEREKEETLATDWDLARVEVDYFGK